MSLGSYSCRIAECLRLPCGTNRSVFVLKTLQYLGQCALGGSAVNNRVRRVLNGELDLLSGGVSSQKGDQHKCRIQSSCHACGADDIAVDHNPCIHKISAVVRHQVPC